MPGIDVEDQIGSGPGMVFDVLERDIFAHYKNGTKVFALTKEGFQESTSGWKNHYITVGIGDIAADNDGKLYPLLKLPHNVTLVDAFIGCDSTVTANSTNYQTLALKKNTSSTALSSLTTASTGFTLHVPREFASIDSTLGKIAAGETVYFSATQSGSGVIMYGVTITLCYSIDRPAAVTGVATDNVFRYQGGGSGTDGVIESDFLHRAHMVVRHAGQEKFRIDVNGKMHGTAPDQFYAMAMNMGTIIDADGEAKVCPVLKPHCTVEIVRAYIGAPDAHVLDSDANYTQVLLKDNSGNIITDIHLDGPYSIGTALEAGVFVDMADVNQQYNRVTSSEYLGFEFITTGTATTIAGLTALIVFKKLD